MTRLFRLIGAIVESLAPMRLALVGLGGGVLAVWLVACSSGPTPHLTDAGQGAVTSQSNTTGTSEGLDLSGWDAQPLPPPRQQANSRWVAVRWQELPGFSGPAVWQMADAEGWSVWLRNCEHPSAAMRPLCPELKGLTSASTQARMRWVLAHFQPYRVESLAGQSQGLLTAYYEPVLQARRQAGGGFSVPLYQPPAGLNARNPWFTRQQIDTLAEARTALRGREIAYLSDPVAAMVLHIQGSGQLQLTEPDGSSHRVRLAFAGTNGQAYQSIGRWLLDQGLTQDASWPGIRQWLLQNPQRSQELMWKNPRYVFFKEQKLTGQASDLGPVGAQGLALTAGRSIAVDPRSIPYGTPAWLVSLGPTAQLQKMVFAQDTGSAIQGAVRADYFAGSGDAAGELAGRLKQTLSLWVLWPRETR